MKTKKSRSNVFKYLIIYVGCILLFGFFYWSYWYFHPDSFIINEQYNLHPFSSVEIQNQNRQNITDYQKKSDSLRVELKQQKDMLRILNSIGDSLAPISNAAFKKLEINRDENINEWEKRQIPDSLIVRQRDLSQFINTLKESGSNELLMAQYEVEKSKLDLYITTIELKSSEYIIKNYGIFCDSSLLNNYNICDSAFNSYRYGSIPRCESKISSLNFEISQLKYDALKNFSSRVSFIDFLLFSSANASTVTYGDIIPNDIVTRIVLFIQAILCIIIIAFSTEALTIP